MAEQMANIVRLLSRVASDGQIEDEEPEISFSNIFTAISSPRLISIPVKLASCPAPSPHQESGIDYVDKSREPTDNGDAKTLPSQFICEII